METALPAEPELDVDEIQGNILSGFKKDFQSFLFLRIRDGQVSHAKAWLRWLEPRVASVREVGTFNAVFRAQRRRRDRPAISATWVNVAVSHPGVTKLVSREEADRLKDAPFRVGLAGRSGLLGDPTDPGSEGHPSRWVVGGPGEEADLVVIVASDRQADLDEEVAVIESGPAGSLQANGLELLYRQDGATRSDLPGHEHFGFKDGISQPAVRGVWPGSPGRFYAARLFDERDPRAPYFAAPGKPLVWPGQFVIGLPRQGDRATELTPQAPADPQPPWARNGSYLVVRRLRQDVPAFWGFVQETAKRLASKPAFAAITPVALASKLVGRWPSGAPLMRAPDHDVEELGADLTASNNFDFLDVTKPAALVPDLTTVDGQHPQSLGDQIGAICPHAAHIRKVNPRDQGTDVGGPGVTLTRLTLRRGIPYGPSLPNPLAADAADEQTDRGLVFASYQASIDRQFEFVSQDWANKAENPRPGGHDLLIGQTVDRSRRFELRGVDGTVEAIETELEWVTPTGGGYFFAPSMSALRTPLGAD